MVKRISILLLLICFCCFGLPFYAHAASTTDAQMPISVETPCSLTLYYGYDGTGISDVTVKLYKVATVSADFQYTLTHDFAHTGLVLNGIQTNDEWDTIRFTLESEIFKNSMEADATAVTDTSGQVVFAQLEAGLYLAICEPATELMYYFDAALVALPGLNEGVWEYAVTAAPKPHQLPENWQVIKLWKGDQKANRPESIVVDIFLDGQLYKTVTLSEDNHWSYSWEAVSGNFMVAEQAVAPGYTATIEKQGNTFVITNAYETPSPTDDPKTGDTANILLYTVLMYLSGSMLILLGIAGRRKKA